MATPETANRWQFSLQTLLVAMAFSAVVFASFSAPGALGGLSMFTIAVTAPGIFISAAISGDRNAKAFSLPALVPLSFGLYAMAWAYGWNLYGASSPADMLHWFETKSSVIKAVCLASWAASLIAGFTGLAVRKLLFRS